MTNPHFSLRDTAERLTPNPARTVEGTLQVIIDGIAKLDDEMLSRTLGYVSSRMQGLDVVPLTDEQWDKEPKRLKRVLMHSAVALKLALREMAKEPAPSALLVP